MDNPMVPKQRQGSQDLSREAPNQSRREAVEAICLDELVEIYAEKLGRDAEMTPEVERLSDPK